MANATGSTVPGSVTGSGNVQADTVDPYGTWGIGKALAGVGIPLTGGTFTGPVITQPPNIDIA